VVVPKTGLTVNLFVGPAGSGKTSLIQMLVGGDPTELPHRCHGYSDTKDFSLYKVVNEGEEHLLLDTPSLSDSMIASLKTFIRTSNLSIGGVFFTVPLGEHVSECQDLIAVLLEALGGREMVRPIAHWLVTQSNLDSKFGKLRCKRDKDDEKLGTFPTLSKHKFGFGVVTHGEENQKDLFMTMTALTSTTRGLPKANMNPDTEQHKSIAKGLRQPATDPVDCGQGNSERKDRHQACRPSAIPGKGKVASMSAGQDHQKQQTTTDSAECGKSEPEKKRTYHPACSPVVMSANVAIASMKADMLVSSQAAASLAVCGDRNSEAKGPHLSCTSAAMPASVMSKSSATSMMNFNPSGHQ